MTMQFIILRFFLFLVCFFLPFFSIALEEKDLSLLYTMAKKGDFYSIGEFQVEKGLKLRYAKFGKSQGKNGALIFVNGKGENILKYIELFYDLYLQGWSPIYTYDHRGQGFSNRISLDIASSSTLSHSPLKGEVTTHSSSIKVSYEKDYSLYRKDMETFIQLVLNDKLADPSNLFLIAHSMGGTIVLDYLQTHGKDQPLKAVAFSSPMIKIKSNLFFLLEKITLKVLTGFCFFSSCSWQLPSLRSRFTQKTLTNSKERYAFSEYVVKQMFPKTVSKGTSFRWIVESFEMTDLLMAENRIQRMGTPFIILQSEQEHFVVNTYNDLFCGKTPYCCQLKKIQGKHEIFMEKDKPRKEAIKTATQFFLNNQKRQRKCKKIVNQGV